MEDPKGFLLKARTRLLFDQPFFGHLVMRLGIVEAKWLPTMATDGRKLYYNPDFVAKQDLESMKAILAHEAAHCYYLHFQRIQNRHPTLWNIAADYRVNADLKECKFILPPDTIQPNPAYADMGTEAIYNDLKRIMTTAIEENPDPGNMGGVMNPKDSHISPEELAADWQVGIRQAAVVAQNHSENGVMPEQIKKLLDRLLTSRVDWRDLLRRFVDNSIIRDWSWTRPNRRFIGSGLFLPGPITDSISHITACLDVSGSIFSCKDALNAFGAELDAIMGDGTIDQLSVIHIDSQVQRVELFERGDVIEVKPQGGGGTVFRPAFDYIIDNLPDTKAVIFFTDLEVNDFGDDPGVPVMWAYYGPDEDFKRRRDSPPFGDLTLHIN